MAAPLLTYRDAPRGHALDDVVRVQLETLYETRLLLQGSSGAGKTQACFHLLEETHGLVQQIVIDKEGEFAKLREKFDYLLIGGDGEQRIPMRKGAIELQLHRVLELEISAIYDLSDLVPDQQRHVVARLARAMAHLPQRSGLWDRMRLALFDEMQWFAPQSGKAESLEPLIELASTGRKRGFCFIAAGTRVSMMAKSVTELLENKLIGRSGMNDAERAAKELEFDKHGRKELRSLPIGHFYAYGPAIAIDPVLVRTPADLPVVPRRRGEHRAPTPATSAKVKQALEKFAGIEEEAEQKERTEAELRTELAGARREILQLRKGAPVVDRVVDKIVVDERAIARAVEAQRGVFVRRLKLAVKDVHGLARGVSAAAQAAGETASRLSTVHGDLVRLGAALETMGETSEAERTEATRTAAAPSVAQPSVPAVGQSSRSPARPIATPSGDAAPGEQRILDALAELHALGIERPTRAQVGILAEYDLNGGVGSRYTSALNGRGWISIPTGGALALTDEGSRRATHPETAITRDALHQRVLARLGDGERRILEYLIGIYPKAQLRADVGAAVRYDLNGGVGSRYTSKLVTLGLVDIPGRGELRAGKLLYPEGL